jgi:hypothetical protein
VASLQVPERVFPRLRFDKRPRFMTSVAFMNLLLSSRRQAARAARRAPAGKTGVPLQPISKEEFERIATAQPFGGAAG